MQCSPRRHTHARGQRCWRGIAATGVSWQFGATFVPRRAADAANDNCNGNSEPRMTRINADRTRRAESDGAQEPGIFWGCEREPRALAPAPARGQCSLMRPAAPSRTEPSHIPLKSLLGPRVPSLSAVAIDPRFIRVYPRLSAVAVRSCRCRCRIRGHPRKSAVPPVVLSAAIRGCSCLASAVNPRLQSE